MGSANVKLQVTPTVSDVITVRIWTVESKEDQRVLHHLLGLKCDAELRVLVRNSIRSVRAEQSIRRNGEYDRWLWILSTEMEFTI